MIMEKLRSSRNQTITLNIDQIESYRKSIIYNIPNSKLANIPIGTICGDYKNWIRYLPLESVDLLILDPPYNLNKSFNDYKFKQMSVNNYSEWFDSMLTNVIPLLKKTASIYVCCDWLSSQSIYSVLVKYFKVQNRITWEREKGRGAKHNWKNSSEDIWFCTNSNDFIFNVEDVKLRRKVIAPYKTNEGQPKDWEETKDGNFRDTYPSNIWTDITIPFWSMPENTDHPTQKSEKLIAKLVLASSNEGDFIFDPFLGSGTTSVVAKKLNRKYLGIDLDEQYCCWAEYRLKLADSDKKIQGYVNNIFWERNSIKQ